MGQVLSPPLAPYFCAPLSAICLQMPAVAPRTPGGKELQVPAPFLGPGDHHTPPLALQAAHRTHGAVPVPTGPGSHSHDAPLCPVIPCSLWGPGALVGGLWQKQAAISQAPVAYSEHSLVASTCSFHFIRLEVGEGRGVWGGRRVGRTWGPRGLGQGAGPHIAGAPSQGPEGMGGLGLFSLEPTGPGLLELSGAERAGG